MLQLVTVLKLDILFDLNLKVIQSTIQDDKEKPTSGLNSSGLVLDVDDSFGSTNLSQSMVSESEDALDTSYDISADEVWTCS